jgi:hypothetical protein
MYIVPPAPQPVTLFSSSGERWSYPSLLAFIEHHGLRWINEYVGPHFRVYCRDKTPWERLEQGYYSQEYPFILRSCHGEVLTSQDCVDAQVAARRALYPGTAWMIRRNSRYGMAWEVWNGKGPVPFTGKTPAGAHYYRCPQTFQEYRAFHAVEPSEGEPVPRGSRRPNYLPSSYFGGQVAARRDRSWKRNRAHQWHPKRRRFK